MSRTDAFALKELGLNDFLFAEVGLEPNGSSLTILSLLARLGQDPWAEVERWTKLPESSIIDCLTNSMSRLPLAPESLIDARTTAVRLIRLLPARARLGHTGESRTTNTSRLPRWAPLAMFFAAVAFAIAFELVPLMHAPANPSPPLAVEQLSK